MRGQTIIVLDKDPYGVLIRIINPDGSFGAVHEDSDLYEPDIEYQSLDPTDLNKDRKRKLLDELKLNAVKSQKRKFLDELAFLPRNGIFPGGREYQESEERFNKNRLRGGNQVTLGRAHYHHYAHNSEAAFSTKRHIEDLIKQGKPPEQGRNKRSGPEKVYTTKGKKFADLAFLHARNPRATLSSSGDLSPSRIASRKARYSALEIEEL